MCGTSRRCVTSCLTWGNTGRTICRRAIWCRCGLESSRTPGELERWLDALLDRVRGPGERELRRAFGVWIRRVLLVHRFPGVDAAVA